MLSLGRFPWIRRLATFGLSVVWTASVLLIAWGIYGLVVGRETAAIEVFLGLSMIGISGMLYGLVTLGAKMESSNYRMYTQSLDLHDLVKRLKDSMEVVAENIQISESAKSITHRDKEREALRSAIREEVFRSDWEAAYYLIEEMERRFGYRAEAERLRQEVDDSRKASIDAKIDNAIAHVEAVIQRHEWDRARREAARLVKLFPNNDRIVALDRRIGEKREAHKRNLLKRWDEVVNRNAVDEAIEILEEMDPYLSRNEAAALQESVRGVFRAKLAQIGVQFSMAVTEHRWSDALEVGLQIMEEYPNSRMAQEVAGNMDALRRRAGMVNPDPAILEQRKPGESGSQGEPGA